MPIKVAQKGAMTPKCPRYRTEDLKGVASLAVLNGEITWDQNLQFLPARGMNHGSGCKLTKRAVCPWLMFPQNPVDAEIANRPSSLLRAKFRGCRTEDGAFHVR